MRARRHRDRPRTALLRPSTRRGLIMIEVLASLFIILVLIGLIIPAIQGTREQGRRISCYNNSKQICLALQHYVIQNRVLPPGAVNESGPIDDRKAGLHIGWMVQILPFMDQWMLSETINTNVSVYAPENQTARKTRINSYLCPSDRLNIGPGPIGYSSYAACHHDVEAPIDVDNRGLLFLNSSVTVEEITDGLSSTIFVGEKSTRSGDLGWLSGTRATLRNTGSRINARDDPANAGLRVGGFGGNHLRGSVFCFGDGSVRFLTESIDPALYQRLGNRADGELVGEGF